jgi:hypothetical protein
LATRATQLQAWREAYQLAIDGRGADEFRSGQFEFGGVEEEGASLVAAEAAEAADQFFKGGDLVSLGVVEAVDVDVGDVVEVAVAESG